MDRRALMTGLAGAALIAASPVWSNSPVRPFRRITGTDEDPPEELQYATSTTLDRIGRIMAPVMVNGMGPYRFVIDTGASHSTLSPALAATLAVEPNEGDIVTLNGVTGAAQVPVVHIDSLEAGALLLEDQRMPIIWSSIMADADGILGVAGLTEQRIDVDFRRNTIEIRRSRGGVRRSGALKIRAQRIAGGLLLVNGRVGRQKTAIIIDTGSERTLGNAALRDALTERRYRNDAQDTEVSGATEHIVDGERWLAPTIKIDELSVGDVEVTFGDFHVFDVWKLQHTPALILGMDVIGVLESLAIDYRRREITVVTTDHQPRRWEARGST
ncbi:MAG: aspartyl protease family protein [Proteobacteria bacterium]|nr:aspartyl protease family protein [Pseudomonadota bacterium]